MRAPIGTAQVFIPPHTLTYRSFFTFIAALIFPFMAFAQDSASAQQTTAAEPGIVERVNAPSSSVSFEMPPALLERVLNAREVEKTEDNSETDAENTEEVEKPVRARGNKTAGYRVQVYSDNNARTAKSTARQRERVISGAFPAYGTYVTYASPYWRLRVGDFRSQYDAEKAANEIKHAFPSFAREVRVVRDYINGR